MDNSWAFVWRRRRYIFFEHKLPSITHEFFHELIFNKDKK